MPEWMNQNENYTPLKDRDRFTGRSLLAVVSVLTKFRGAPAGPSRSRLLARSTPLPRLLLVIALIALVSASRNMFFTYIVTAGVLIACCRLPAGRLSQVFLPAAAATLLSALLLLPAIFLGSPHTLLTVSIKVFVSVSLGGLLAATTPWNALTAGLAACRVPGPFILTLDLTLKYIVILGELAAEMLQALRLRSVGRDPSKARSVSGVLGVLYLKSRRMAEETAGAMACRGFDGEYRYGHQRSSLRGDLPCLLLLAAAAGLFAWLETH